MDPLVVDGRDSAGMVVAMAETSVRPVPLRRYHSCRGHLPVVDRGEPGVRPVPPYQPSHRPNSQAKDVRHAPHSPFPHDGIRPPAFVRMHCCLLRRLCSHVHRQRLVSVGCRIVLCSVVWRSSWG